MRRLGGALAVLLATATGPVLAAGPAAADDPYDVPDAATITVTGDGSGHGKGLSQYGAYGAARKGKTAEQILDFYYPGTGRGRVAGTVAVLISGDDGRSMVVRARRGLTLQRAAGGRTWRLAEPRATQWRLQPDRRGNTVVSYRTNRWHAERTVRGGAQVSAGGAPVSLMTPHGTVAYRGTLRTAGRAAVRTTVNVVAMESYLRGVVPAEVSPSLWPQEAMRAQAVAARTYAAYERAHAGSRAYDLCDTAACQAYGGASAEARASSRAVGATARTVLTYGGELAFAQYSASNGGYTVDGGEPYLPAQPDPYEGTSPDFYGWTVRIPARKIEQAYNIDNLTSIAITERDGHGRDGNGGRVLEVRLANADSGWSGTVTGDSFRRNFGLSSTMFRITGVR